MRRWKAVLPILAGVGALWSIVPFSMWWMDTEPSHLAGAWRTWGWGSAVVAGATAVVLILTRWRVTDWMLLAWRRSIGRMRARGVVALAASVLFVFALLVFVFLFAGNPRSVDGFAQLFHARMLLAGRLWIPPPESLAHFGTLHMALGPDRWFSQYPPGQPFVLAAGLWVGTWWLLLPLFGALLVAATYRIARWTADDTTAKLAALLLAVCPFVVVMTATELNHVPAAALGIAAAAAATRLGGHRWHWWAVLAGAVLGLMVAFRPLDAVAAAFPVAAVTMVAARRRVPALALVGLGGVIGTMPTLWFNAMTTGAWNVFGYEHVWGVGIALGFHATPWGVPLTPLRAVALTSLDLHQLNLYLFDLPVPVLVVITGGLALGYRQLTLRDGLPFVAIIALMGLLFFYFHRDVFYGPRLLFSIVPWFVLLLARSIVLLRRWESTTPGGRPRGPAAVTGVLTALIVGTIFIAPSRLAAYRESTPMLSYQPERDAEDAGITNAVVLVPDGWGTRLIARMWQLGIPVRRTGRLYAAIDACTLELALDATDGNPRAAAGLLATLDSLAALERPGVRAGLTDDGNLRLPPPAPLPAACLDEIAFDQAGFLAFAPFLYLNDASLDGDIVWARDMRDRNGPLLEGYPGRTVYRYGPTSAGPPAFTPVR